MKKTFALLLMGASLYSCNQAKETTSTPEATASTVNEETTQPTGTTYGAAFVEENVMTTVALQEALLGKDSVQATVSAEILESCQAKGCWANVKMADNSSMKVTFRDYAFFLPVEDLKGREVVFTGTAKKQVTPVEELQHYAKDAGKSEEEIKAITEPKEEIRFVADGIVLK